MFYSLETEADSASFSPSAAKPAVVMESWYRMDLPLAVRAPVPVTRAQFKTAHDPQMVDRILDCKQDNRFGNRSEAVARSLRHTSGAMLGAAREALVNGRVAVALYPASTMPDTTPVAATAPSTA